MATIYIYSSPDQIEKTKISFRGNYLIFASSKRRSTHKGGNSGLFDYYQDKISEIEKYGGYMDEEGPTMPSVISQEWEAIEYRFPR